ncbi:response regulator [Colwellia sp. UCD-KL20]|uniref:response regulator n=1 Tax=Colwellia sp. UCD-KL20 TaxID=1917165 RepID=UPI000970B293|nr:response regulator [Colwellia sp. UCD-KL20]
MTDIVNVFYVEDDKDEVELMSLYLNRYNLQPKIVLHIADTVDEAKQMFNLEKYSLALIDWNLPDGTGGGIALHIRNADSSFPIVFLSGLVTVSLVNEAKTYDPEAFLEKDYNKKFIEEIYAILKRDS